MVDVVEEFLGITQEEDPEITAIAKENALSIVKLVESPEWEVLASFLESSMKECDQGCEVYAANHNSAIIDTGRKYQLNRIQHFIQDQYKIIEKYVEQNQRSQDSEGAEEGEVSG